ncbi:DUF2695 domain-containing protein [Pseudonocardia sp. TRM90224]|uniref:DUF2695 domain-containing protein n=1 Tax=Pseudonocardia sp. TRM90224 TaxID=2812678 RepID=UPI001E50897E|nr:DUF2695 domain-containing protein [Pseudonocardia sp. TRM90224]
MASEAEKAERKQLKDEYLRAQQTASAARMPLDRAQLQALLDHVHAAVALHGCDHTRAATDDWAEHEGIDLERHHEGLEEYGGYCHCEVIMDVDVDVDEVFTPVRMPHG